MGTVIISTCHKENRLPLKPLLNAFFVALFCYFYFYLFSFLVFFPFSLCFVEWLKELCVCERVRVCM